MVCFKHIPHSTFRVCNLGIGLGFHGSIAPENTYYTPRLWIYINFRDWFGVSCLYCTLQSTLETTFKVFNLRIGYSPAPVTKPISEPGQTKVCQAVKLPYINSIYTWNYESGEHCNWLIWTRFCLVWKASKSYARFPPLCCDFPPWKNPSEKYPTVNRRGEPINDQMYQRRSLKIEGLTWFNTCWWQKILDENEPSQHR